MGAITLTEDEIRERVRDYAREQQKTIEAEFLERRRTDAISETHRSVLLDLLEACSYALEHSDYRRMAPELARFLGVPEEQAVSDPDLARARREWTRATQELHRYHLGLYQGKLMTGEVDYLPKHAAPDVTTRTQSGEAGNARKLSDWVEAFVERRVQSAQIGRDAQDRYRNAVANFELLVGPVAAAEITGEHVTAFISGMQRLPRQRHKLEAYRGMSVEELLEANVPEQDLFAPTTINGYLQALGALMKWLRESHAAVRINPFEGVSIKAAPTTRLSYTEADLERIFTSVLWKPASSYAQQYGTASSWWLPILALFTGARLAELVQLPLERVCSVDGVLCLDLTDAKRDKLKLKTASAERRIPVHPELERLGLVDYVAEMRANGAARLLDAIPLGRDGKGKKASDWYTRYRNTNFPEFGSQSKDFHSFRTTHGTQAVTCGIDRMLLKQWFGHSGGQKDDVTEKNYNTGQPVPMLYEELSKLRWDVGALQNMPQGWRGLRMTQRSARGRGMES